MSVVDWAGGAPGSVIDENTAHEPRPKDRGAYTAAKLEAERLVTRCAEEQGLPAVILRPGQIYGGAIPLLTPAVARKAGKRWLVLGNGNLRLPLVHMDDVVEAVFRAANSNLERGEIIQLVADNAPTQNEVLRGTQGPGAKVIRVPLPVVYALGGLSEVLLGLLKRKSPLSRYRLSSALTSRTFACRNAHLLGWTARVDNETGIRQQASPRRVEEPASAAEGPVRAPALKA
jgi:nucleoside-diphosphate-sugar epimerase